MIMGKGGTFCLVVRNLSSMLEVIYSIISSIVNPKNWYSDVKFDRLSSMLNVLSSILTP
jgi:hypothetical protein